MALTTAQAEAIAVPLCKLLGADWLRRQERPRRFRRLEPSTLGRRFGRLARRTTGATATT